MYASLGGTCFASSQQLFKKAGRKFGHRKVSLEDIRHRLQIVHELWFLDRTRICWILWFNEARAMSSVCCDQTYVSYDQKPVYFYSTPSGYKPQVRDIEGQQTLPVPEVQQFDKVSHRLSVENNRIAAENTFTYVPASEIYARLDVLGHTSHIDASIVENISGYMGGFYPVIIGGCMTSIQQIADTDLHRHFKKEYKKRMSCRTTVNATDS